MLEFCYPRRVSHVSLEATCLRLFARHGIFSDPAQAKVHIVAFSLFGAAVLYGRPL
jgi:hypothetical protein